MCTVEEVVNQAYLLFAHYPAERPLDVCTVCCMSADDELKLASLPVKDIPRDLLANYNDSARPENTRITEIKHFLPRYLELISQFQFPSHSVEISLSRIMYFDKNEWLPAEQKLLHDFIESFFRKYLSTYSTTSLIDSIESIMIMFQRAGFAIEPLLAIWEKDKTKESVLHFRDLHFYAFTNDRKKLTNAFAAPKLSALLNNWLEQREVKENFSVAIEALFMMENDLNEKDIQELSLLYDLIRQREKDFKEHRGGNRK